MLHVWHEFQFREAPGCLGGRGVVAVSANDVVATLADLHTVDGFVKYFALRPVPAYGRRYVLAILIVPTPGGICLSKVRIRTGGRRRMLPVWGHLFEDQASSQDN